jgi:hypothetical protein
MEHFEFADIFFRFFGELSRHLNPSVSPEEEEAANQFGRRVAESLFGWYNLGLDNCQPWSEIAETIASGDVRCQHFEVLTVYCIKTLQRMAEISWDLRYENDGSRGNGGRSIRRREIQPRRLPTPQPSQGPSSMPNNSPVVITDNEGERPQKRRRLAPVPLASAVSMQTIDPRENLLASFNQLPTLTGPVTGSGNLHPLPSNMGTGSVPGVIQSSPNTEILTPNSFVQLTHPVHPAQGPGAHLGSTHTGVDGIGPEVFNESWDGTYWTHDIPEFLTKLDRQHTPME